MCGEVEKGIDDPQSGVMEAGEGQYARLCVAHERRGLCGPGACLVGQG